MSDGTKLVGQVSGTDPADDLAVVKINPPANMPVATLGNSSQLKVGQDVLAIGNPLGITQTVTNGIVSALNRTVSEGQGGANLPDAVQTDAPINPGNSGGALVDMQGNLIGIPTLTAIDPEFNAPASGVGFAIPSNRVNFIVPQIIQSGKVTHTGRAALGISAVPVDQSVQAQDNLSVDHGVLIAGLVNGGGAQNAGLQVGDVIVQVNNQDVTDTSTLTAALLTRSPGDTVPVKIYRGSQQMTVNVTLGELQAELEESTHTLLFPFSLPVSQGHPRGCPFYYVYEDASCFSASSKSFFAGITVRDRRPVNNTPTKKTIQPTAITSQKVLSTPKKRASVPATAINNVPARISTLAHKRLSGLNPATLA